MAAIVVLLGGGALAFVLTREHATTTAQHSPSESASSTPTPGSVPFTDPQSRYTVTFAGKPEYHNTTSTSPQGDVPYMYAEYTGFDVDQVIGVLLLPAGST